jgi:hypothetical protein
MRTNKTTAHAPADPASPNEQGKRNLTRAEASKYLLEAHGLSYAPTTLARFAMSGEGPGFFKTSVRVLYPRAELDRWAVERLGNLVHSTARDAA